MCGKKNALLLAGSAAFCLLVPSVASAQVVIIDDGEELTIPVTITGLDGVTKRSNTPETVDFSGYYFSTSWASKKPGERVVADVILTEPDGSFSDILHMIFFRHASTTVFPGDNVFVVGNFSSDPFGAGHGVTDPHIVETGDWQDVSSLLQSQGAPTDFTVVIKSDLESVPEPGFYALLASLGVSGVAQLRRLRSSRSLVPGAFAVVRRGHP